MKGRLLHLRFFFWAMSVALLPLGCSGGNDDDDPPPQTANDDDDEIVNPPPKELKLDLNALSDRYWVLPDMTFGVFSQPAFVGSVLGSMYDAQTGPKVVIQRRSGHGLYFDETERWTVTPIEKHGLGGWFETYVTLRVVEMTEKSLAIELAVVGGYDLILPNVALALAEIRTTLRFDAETHPDFPTASTRYRFQPQQGTAFEGMCESQPEVCDDNGYLTILAEGVSIVEVGNPSEALPALLEGCDEGVAVAWEDLQPITLTTERLDDDSILQPPGWDWLWPDEPIEILLGPIEEGTLRAIVSLPVISQGTRLHAVIEPGGCFRAIAVEGAPLDPHGLEIQTRNWIVTGRLSPDMRSAREISVGLLMTWPDSSSIEETPCEKFPVSCSTEGWVPFLVSGLEASIVE